MLTSLFRRSASNGREIPAGSTPLFASRWVIFCCFSGFMCKVGCGGPPTDSDLGRCKYLGMIPILIPAELLSWTCNYHDKAASVAKIWVLFANFLNIYHLCAQNVGFYSPLRGGEFGSPMDSECFAADHRGSLIHYSNGPLFLSNLSSIFVKNDPKR